MVVYCHIAATYQDRIQHLPEPLYRFLENGANGVRLFFSISGFILAIPFVDSARISVHRFYLRRLERLEPTYFVAITAFYLLLTIISHKSISLGHYFATLTYTHQLIYQEPSSILPATWSLEVEFQFYALAPLLGLAFRCGKIWRRILLIGLMLLAVWVNATFVFPFKSLVNFLQFFLLGTFAADLYRNELTNEKVGKLIKLLNQKYWIVYGILLLTIAAVDIRSGSMGNDGIFLTASLALFVLYLGGGSPVYAGNTRTVALIGGMCYTIYLYHTLLISLASRIAVRIDAGLAVFAILSLAAILVACPGLFLVLERPFMRKQWYKAAERGSSTSVG